MRSTEEILREIEQTLRKTAQQLEAVGSSWYATTEEIASKHAQISVLNEIANAIDSAIEK